jgi:hypothetical protein
MISIWRARTGCSALGAISVARHGRPAAGQPRIADRPDRRWGGDWLHRTYLKWRARSH